MTLLNKVNSAGLKLGLAVCIKSIKIIFFGFTKKKYSLSFIRGASSPLVHMKQINHILNDITLQIMYETKECHISAPPTGCYTIVGACSGLVI